MPLRRGNHVHSTAREGAKRVTDKWGNVLGEDDVKHNADQQAEAERQEQLKKHNEQPD